MTKNIITNISLLFSLSFGVAACSSGTTPAAADPGPSGTRQQLVAKGDCTFEECGSAPSFEGAAKLECSASANDACEWSADGNDGVVGYTYCQDSECPPRPAIDCPADTVKASQQCGNENNAGCAWTTVCVPPRETTPCPAQNGCDDEPQLALGVICSDGSPGGFACVTDGQKCFWERNCD
jgi:hypothetical protein